jgi:DUF2917 family protein
MTTKRRMKITSLGLNTNRGDLKSMPVLKNSIEHPVRVLTQEPSARGNLRVLSYNLTKGKTQWKETEVHLNANSVFRIDGDGTGAVIVCQSGTFWITQEDDPQDYILQAGDEFVISKKGSVVLQVLSNGFININKKY